MTTIIYQDKASGSMYMFHPSYPAQRSLFELKRTERIIAAIKELSHVGNINIFLLKKGRLRKIAEHGF